MFQSQIIRICLTAACSLFLLLLIKIVFILVVTIIFFFQYTGCTQEDNEIIWFWKVVSQLKEEEKALLMKFSTGTPCVPIGGFAALTVIRNRVFSLTWPASMQIYWIIFLPDQFTFA